MNFCEFQANEGYTLIPVYFISLQNYGLCVRSIYNSMHPYSKTVFFDSSCTRLCPIICCHGVGGDSDVSTAPLGSIGNQPLLGEVGGEQESNGDELHQDTLYTCRKVLQ